MVRRAVGWMIAVGFAPNRRPTGAGPEVVVVRLSAGSGSLVIDCGTHMADIVFVNPRFEVSYWGLEHALPLIGKRANLPTACLPLLAALTPAGHSVSIVDENVEPLDFDRLAAGRYRGADGHERAADPDAGDSLGVEIARRIYGRRRDRGLPYARIISVNWRT